MGEYEKIGKRSIMVTLKIIIKTADSISADYYPESSDIPCFIKFSIDGTVIESHLTEMDGYLKWYFRFARNRLEEYLESGVEEFPERTTVMWY